MERDPSEEQRADPRTGAGKRVDRTVLIVDDDEDSADLLRLLFEESDFRVVGEARDGVEAIALTLRHRPSVVILDYMMPRLDGEKTAEILRTLAPESRIVAFSAILRTRPPWADAYLNKDRIAEIAPLLAQMLELEDAKT